MTIGSGSAHTETTTISTFDLRRRLEAAAAAEYHQSRRQFQIRDREGAETKAHCRGSRAGRAGAERRRVGCMIDLFRRRHTPATTGEAKTPCLIFPDRAL